MILLYLLCGNDIYIVYTLDSLIYHLKKIKFSEYL